MRRALRKYLRLLKGRDKGTVAITFLLSLPILLTIIGVLVQYALLANARLTVDRATQSAARSAMTSLPVDSNIGEPGGAANVLRSALMTLESLSPAALSGNSADSQTIAEALATLGTNPPASYAARYTFAEQATIITIQPIDMNGNPNSGTDYPRIAAPRVRITIQYSFQLTVPLMHNLIGRTATIAGITGRFTTITSTLDVQLSHGRQTPTDGVGDP